MADWHFRNPSPGRHALSSWESRTVPMNVERMDFFSYLSRVLISQRGCNVCLWRRHLSMRPSWANSQNKGKQKHPAVLNESLLQLGTCKYPKEVDRTNGRILSWLDFGTNCTVVLEPETGARTRAFWMELWDPEGAKSNNSFFILCSYPLQISDLQGFEFLGAIELAAWLVKAKYLVQAFDVRKTDGQETHLLKPGLSPLDPPWNWYCSWNWRTNCY